MSIWHARDTPYVPHTLIHTVTTWFHLVFAPILIKTSSSKWMFTPANKLVSMECSVIFFIIYFKYFIFVCTRAADSLNGVQAMPQRRINSLFHAEERSHSLHVWSEHLQIYFDQRYRQNGEHIVQCVSSVVCHYLL